MNKIITSVSTFILCIGLISCEKQEPIPSPGENENKIKGAASKDIAESNNKFGFNLFYELIRQKPDDNILISPFSISTALTMTSTGAQGQTRADMKNTLALSNLSDSQINGDYRKMIPYLENLDALVDVGIANSAWYSKNYPFESTFSSHLKEFYHAEGFEVDYSDNTGTTNLINSWVNDKTNGKIPSILESVNSDDRLYLVNAIFFKGNWTKEFSTKSTGTGTFYAKNNEQINCLFMNCKDTLLYAETQHFQIVDKPYGDNKYSMMILIPKNNNAYETIPLLDNETYQHFTKTLKETEIIFSLPKFKLEYEKELPEALTNLGMGIAFSNSADFSGISTKEGLQINKVKHKAFIEVDETGTEAAAATAVGVGPTSMPAIPVVHANKPFTFIIRDRGSNVILFVGKVNRPVS